jgi:NAD(P)-dependent dehydrogenase (short-subunit alcohol dehydrogenase family)
MSESEFQGKVIAITGGASGMGLATAKLLASRGALVSIADVQEKGLQEVKSAIEEAGGKVMVTTVDVRNSKQVEDWISQTVAKFGKLDGCANLAGVIGKDVMVKNVDEIDSNDWDFVLGVNLTGLMHCLRAQIPVMNSPGSIVNAASISGQMGHAMNGAYCASKHGVIGLSRCAAKECGPNGIRVNCFAP